MAEQDGTELIKQVVLGIVQFTVVFWWRTTFADLLDLLVPRDDVEEERANRAMEMEKRKFELE